MICPTLGVTAGLEAAELLLMDEGPPVLLYRIFFFIHMSITNLSSSPERQEHANAQFFFFLAEETTAERSVWPQAAFFFLPGTKPLSLFFCARNQTLLSCYETL